MAYDDELYPRTPVRVPYGSFITPAGTVGGIEDPTALVREITRLMSEVKLKDEVIAKQAEQIAALTKRNEVLEARPGMSVAGRILDLDPLPEESDVPESQE